MAIFFHPGDLGTDTLIFLCILGIAGPVAITLGLMYLAGLLAQKHGERYERTKPEDNGEMRDA